jgi:excisionase family DNA binding protein
MTQPNNFSQDIGARFENFQMAEVCELLKISERTFYRYVSSGRLPATKVGGTWRVRPAEIERLLDPEQQRKRKANRN